MAKPVKNLILDDTLQVGVDEIDEDHRRLVDLFNILSQSVEIGDAADYIEAVLEELINCTAWHFSHEERLMLLYKYEGLEGHKAEHHELIESVRALQQKFRQQDKLLTNEDIDYLSNWLTEHILGYDMKLGFYLADRM